MSNDVEADFARLHGTSQIGASGFNAAKTHPLFGAVHSFALAHKYGQADPYTYINNPRLRTVDTRDAALAGLQSVGARFRARNSQQVQTAAPTQAPAPTVNVQGMINALAGTQPTSTAKKTPPSANWIG